MRLNANSASQSAPTTLPTTNTPSTQEDLFSTLLTKRARIAVVGLGYVGLPIALEFGKFFSVVGYDINEQKVRQIKNSVDPAGELDEADFREKTVEFSHQARAMRDAKFFVVAVPTPIDEFNQPNLNALRGATKTVGAQLKKGDYVVFESTVYPGCTEEVCVPILEEVSGLKFKQDFKVGYSPERINPGDKVNTIDKIVKIVSACDEESLNIIAEVYGLIIKAGIHKAASIKVAEAAKIVENTQRDVNVALMNELSLIFEKEGINTYDVLQAASTKWNFLNFHPGLVGGHCIGVDPYYLIQRSIRLGHNPILISAGRTVNDSMPSRLSNRIAKTLREKGIQPSNAKVLLQGITFKENVSDIRNSKAAELAIEMKRQFDRVDIVDPLANPSEIRQEYGLELKPTIGQNYDVVVIAVSHKAYRNCDENYYKSISKPGAIIFDVKGILRNQIEDLNYCSL